MSSVGRAAPRGSKSGKFDNSVSNKSQKSDNKTETLKTDNSKAQPTAEQMRIAQLIDAKIDDPLLKEKIQQVIDATHKSELEACAALHDCDNDLDRAVNLLLEGQTQGWEVSVKKKKNRQPSVNSKAESSTKAVSGDTEDWNEDTPAKPPTDGPQPRGRPRGSGGPPRMRGRGSLDNRGWRGRENKENERNLEGGSAVGPGGDRDTERDGFRRGGGGGRGGRMSNGPSRGGGRGGSRMGPRTFQSRGGDRNSGPSSGGFPRSIETWNNPDHESTTTDNKAATFPSPEDWDNEEYTGSLADTKVFTPSTAGMPDGPSGAPSSAQVTNVSAGEASMDGVNSNTNAGLDLHSAPTNSLLSQSPVTAGGLALNPAQSQYLSQLTRDSQLSSQLSNQISSQLSNSTDEHKLTSLSLAGSTAATSVSNAPASYANSYSASTYAASAAQSSMYSAAAAAAAAAAGVSSDGVYAGYQAQQNQSGTYANAYSGQDRGVSQPTTASQPLPARTKTQRAKMPAPSKIPSSAVEMPGDAVNSSIGFLDVQFGGLDLCTETFDTSSTASEPQASPQPSQNQTKFSGGSGGADSSATSAAQASLDVSAQSSLDSYSKSSLSQSLTMNNAGFILQQTQQQQGSTQQQSPSQSQQQQSSEMKGSQSSAYAQQSRGPSGVGVGSSLDGLVKNDGISSSNASSGNTSASHAYSGTSSSYQSNYQSQKNSSSGYQPSVSYNAASTYSPSQATSASTGYTSNQAPSSYTNSSYSSSTAPSNAYPSNSYGNAQGSGSGYSTSSGAAPSGSSASAATTYPSISQPAGYPASAASQGYQSGVYGNSSASNTGSASVLGSTSGYTTSSSTPYQNSYSAPTASNKLSSSLSSGTKDQQFDTTATASSTLSNSVSGAVSASPALGLTAVNNTTSTKVSTSAAKSSVVANMPPGMQPIMTGTPQYIINQGGLPYFQQPVYGYDDQQLLQLRIPPHMTTGYYDIPFPQAPTSLAAGREGSIASVQYSMSDGRFARTDNASPVPSSVSQQQNATQPHQQPMMNAASFPQGYAYYYSSLPANYQYGTPMYPQPVAPATNAHGNSNTSQYTKQGNYGSGYGLGYEGLSGSQDYSKPGGYVSGSQTGSKTGVGANAPSTGASGSDLYTKGHVTLSKVNSYEKQGFHSGTPPPFNLASSQSTGLAPSGAYPPHLFIPTMPPHHQQHSTTLMHQPLHQIEMRSPVRRVDSGTSSGQRSQSSTQPNKAGAKQTYSPSYWTPN